MRAGAQPPNIQTPFWSATNLEFFVGARDHPTLTADRLAQLVSDVCWAVSTALSAAGVHACEPAYNHSPGHFHDMCRTDMCLSADGAVHLIALRLVCN